MRKLTRRRGFSLMLGGAALLLLSGCGDDSSESRQTLRPQTGNGSSAPVATAPPLLASEPAAPTSAHSSDPLAQTPDPLLSGSTGSGNAAPGDPLLGHDPLARRDPLSGHDPLQGPAMPTDHSHWLRGRVRDARLTVLLNGIREGDYSGMVDQDITMKLRAGINTVSFVYTPRDTGSSAQMDLTESEHDPPIPPLASFRSTPPSGTSDLPAATQTFTFFAK